MKVNIKFSQKSNVTYLQSDIEKMSRELAKAKLQELVPGARFIAVYEVTAAPEPVVEPKAVVVEPMKVEPKKKAPVSE